MSKQQEPTAYTKVRRAFDKDGLKHICEMHESEFADLYMLDTYEVGQAAPDDFYLHKDNGSDILAVAHLDTVGLHKERTARFVQTEGGPVIFSRALDDRLGAYTILELLPVMGINVDILLTVGEEQGCSTAAFFEPQKEYNWGIEFDRGGTDVVTYQYEDKNTTALVQAVGPRVGVGAFSDISYLEHLEIKCFNWGVGYRDYHGPRAHAYLEDYWSMIAAYTGFHEANADTYLPHEMERAYGGTTARSIWETEDTWDEEDWDHYFKTRWPESDRAKAATTGYIDDLGQHKPLSQPAQSLMEPTE
jgi:hypothetical protein